MKKLLISLLTLTLIALSLPAQANLKNRNTSLPTLVVVDTALDTSIPSIKEKLIYEVCILDWPSCPNGKNFMEGPGSSVLPMSILSNSNFNHGTQMTSVAISNNPNMNIIFIRIIGHTSRGTRQLTSINTIPNALSWVVNNRTKYNIAAVSISQGNHSVIRNTTSNYCPVNATDTAVNTLYSLNIPVFFPAGNDRDYSRIDWPACIPNAVAVGGSESYGAVSLISNYDKNLIDIWAPISQLAFYPGGSQRVSFGTSVSNQVAAAKYVSLKFAKPLLTLPQALDLIKKTGTPISNSLKNDGLLLNIEAAING